MNISSADENFLQLSGIQHIAFCERQWALIHLEQQWRENLLTVEGHLVHEKADNPFANDTRKEVRIIRGLQVTSQRLGLHGVCDIVEFVREDELPSEETVILSHRRGRWRISPIEYKRGRPKPDDRDEVQLCAQAYGLEEMFHTKIKEGYIYYHSTRKRQLVVFTEELRKHVEELSLRMHFLAQNEVIPMAIKEKHCLSCSLYETCQPDWKSREYDVENYLRRYLAQDGNG